MAGQTTTTTSPAAMLPLSTTSLRAMRATTVESTMMVLTKSPTSAVSPPVERMSRPSFTQVGQEGFCALDDFSDDFAWDEMLVAADGAGHQNGSSATHTKQVVHVHDQCVLGNALPHTQVPRFLPIHVGEGRLGPGAVRMHHHTVVFAPRQMVGDNLAKRLGEQPLVDAFNGGMDLFLARGNPARSVPCVAHVLFVAFVIERG